MQKRLLSILIGLMSISLIGIIAVQIYWIVDSVQKKDEQFSFAINQSLASVSNELKLKEAHKFYSVINAFKDSVGIKPTSSDVFELLLVERNSNREDILTYRNSLLTENYKLDPQLLDLDVDSITFTKISNRSKKTIKSQTTVDGRTTTDAQTIDRIIGMDDFELRYIENAARDIYASIPIASRVTTEEVDALLQKEFSNREITTDFEFAIHQDGYPTRIKSADFNFLPNATWGHEIFSVEDGKKGVYKLMVNIPDRKSFILSSITGMALLSLLFTSVIIVAYSNAIRQIFKQRQISQIKTDFINNMTHEFKTPIATINLALDSLKHPRIATDPEKVKNYLRMIREENKRMHSQVENVLQISKLEKNELNIKKERLEVNSLIEDAVSHVQLILDECGGQLKTHFGALRTDVLGNDSHLTNVLVNITENAIKYSDKPPIIDIYTENHKDLILIKIRDQGIGMSKVATRKVFQKFFREHTGDIHNVKGHGLGLAYAKRILEDHQGKINVDSEKGKGSTFTVQLPLIT